MKVFWCQYRCLIQLEFWSITLRVKRWKMKKKKKMFKKKRKRDIKESVLITSLGKLCMGQRSPHIKGLVVMQTETIKAVTCLPERTWLLCFLIDPSLKGLWKKSDVGRRCLEGIMLQRQFLEYTWTGNILVWDMFEICVILWSHIELVVVYTMNDISYVN